VSRRARPAVVLALLVFAAAPPCAAGPLEQPPTIAIGKATVTPHLSDRLRGEFVDWFDPGPAAAPNDDDNYQFFANVLHVGGTVAAGRFTLFADAQYVALVGLPDDAAGLGPGATYFLNNRRENPNEIFLREGWVRITDLGVPGLSLRRGGRFKYDDGLENAERVQDPGLRWIKGQRISQRLIGNFDYTHAGRSLDGGQLAYAYGPLDLTFLGGQPTAGGFNLSANPHIDGIFLTYLAATVTEPDWLPGSDMRLFHLYYEDARDLVATDNRPLDVRQDDRTRAIRLHTFGGHLVHVRALGPGHLDALLWVAGQTGDWQSQDHGAWGLAAELGYQWRALPWAPWVRTGYFRSSGDGDPADAEHKTFFQALPPFFNLMNNQDAFFQLVLTPLASVSVRADYHYLEVAADADLLYSGGGATQQDRIFGYAGFPARGRESVAHFADLTVIWDVSRHLQFWVYYGHAFGERVIAGEFPESQQLDYAFLESTIRW
jgi:hypothetical protein